MNGNHLSSKVKTDPSKLEKSETHLTYGIGSIWFKTDNLQLEQIMEALDEVIDKHGPIKVLQMLQTIS